MQLCFHRPLETTRMVLGGIAAHNQHHVGVLDVDPAVSHRAASEGGPQTGDRRTVSNTGLRFEIADPQAAHGLDGEKIQFVRVSASTNPTNRFQAIDRVAVLVFVDEGCVTRLLGPASNFVDCLIPGNVFPITCSRPSYLRLQQTTIVDDILFERCAFGTECPAIDWMIGIALDDRRLLKPQVRRPGASDWEDISWDNAINEIARWTKKTRDAAFIDKDKNGYTVNRLETIGWIGGCTDTNELNFLAVKTMRSLGVCYFETQARV